MLSRAACGTSWATRVPVLEIWRPGGIGRAWTDGRMDDEISVRSECSSEREEQGGLRMGAVGGGDYTS